MRYHCLDQQVVVITGASSGIGEALAHQFYSAGCRVVLASRRVGELERVRSDLLRKTSDDIRFIRPDIVQLDLLEVDKIPAKCAQILEQCKHVDILINNGGVSLRSDVLSVTSEVDQRMMKINYLGAVALTKGKYASRQFDGDEFDRLVSIFVSGFLPSMIRRRQGSIAFVSSVVGRLPIPYRSAYTASKHALQAFADCLRAEIASSNVKVFVSSPGYVATNVSLNALTGSGRPHGGNYSEFRIPNHVINSFHHSQSWIRKQLPANRPKNVRLKFSNRS